MKITLKSYKSMRLFHLGPYVRLNSAGHTDPEQKHFCATLYISVLTTSRIHTECIVALPLQKWLSEGATILRGGALPLLFFLYDRNTFLCTRGN